MVNQFFVRDAREKFLEPGTVDLFITHPPYFQEHRHFYGGDATKQIHNQESHQGFVEDLTTIIGNMEEALSENGSILLMMPNTPKYHDIVASIKSDTNLQLGKTLIWDHSSSGEVENPYDDQDIVNFELKDFTYILCLHKGNDRLLVKDDFRVITLPWLNDDVYKYRKITGVYDAMPTALYAKLIEDYSKPGETVGDLMAGVGSIAVAAKQLNRYYVYNDLSETQANVARLRLGETIMMTKADVVKLMSNAIDDMNRSIGEGQGVPSEQIQEQLILMRPQLDHVNGMLYDLLVEYGLIVGR